MVLKKLNRTVAVADRASQKSIGEAVDERLDAGVFQGVTLAGVPSYLLSRRGLCYRDAY